MFCTGSVVWAREGGEGILGNNELSRLFRGCDYRDYKMIEWPFKYSYCVELGLGELSVVNIWIYC